MLDFTWVLAGPYGTRILADYGADVIKVQTDRRMVGYVGNGYFTTWNRNKRSIALDLDFPEAKEIARKLAVLSDIVVDNFSARVMRSWGLDEDSLRGLRPDLISAHLSGMGHDGPYANYVSYGPTAQALSGMTALTSYENGRPVGFGFSYSDHVAGLTMANAVLAALDYRDRTGVGQTIDVSQFESTAYLMGTAYLEAAVGNPPAPVGNAVANGGVFRCLGEDRWIAVEAPTPRAETALRALVGEGDITTAISRWASSRAAEEAVMLLQDSGIAASVVASAEDLVERDEGLRARHFWIEAEHPQFGRTRFDGPPPRLSATPSGAPRPSPILGQHSRDVYGDLLGLSDADIHRLTDSGVFR